VCLQLCALRDRQPGHLQGERLPESLEMPTNCGTPAKN